MSRPLVLAVEAIIFSIASPCSAAEPADKDIADWVAQLDSTKFAEREAAQKKLAALSAIPPALYEAARSTNAETARRAKAAIAAIDQRLAEQRLQAALAAINADGLDLYVERLAQSGPVTDEHWRSLVRVVDALTTRARGCGPSGLNLTTDWMSIQEMPHTVGAGGRVLIKHKPENRFSAVQSFVVSPGSLPHATALQNSVLIVLGDIEGFTSVTNCFVLCTGRMGRATSVRDSIILSRGDFEGSTTAERSLFQAKSIGGHSRAVGCTYVNLSEVVGANAAQNNYVKTERSPLDAVQFFDAAKLGLAVRQAETETYVESLKSQSLFERFGVHKGDELLSVGGRKWNTAEEFRTALLRARLNESTVLRVRRGDRVVEIPVNFRDQPVKK